VDVEPDPEGLVALREGRGYANLSAWRKVLVTGSDAAGWLNDLISADIAGLEPGRSRRSLLLGPTGRIRAEFTVAPLEDGRLLTQDPEQPGAIDDLLRPYVLSSDVRLADRSGDFALLGIPGPRELRIANATARWAPSALGRGEDVLVDLQDDALPETVETLAAAGLMEAGLESLEAWRVERGVARFGTDLLEDSLPHEAAVDDLIAYSKGCFLGQEAVAKVRNLGHPPKVVLRALTDGRVGAGDALSAEGQEVGLVTSATPLPDGRTAVILRVGWSVREAALRTSSGAEVEVRGQASL
jgi:folate-binding protein YgfZ